MEPETPQSASGGPSTTPSEGERKMSLRSLENLLGVTEEDVKKEEVVSKEVWKRMSEAETADGSTLLMRAAEEGALDCVEFLLRCGSDVNVLTSNKKRAIDYAIERNHSEVALLLFRSDSRLPKIWSDERKTFQALQEHGEEVRKLFEERDSFHVELKKGKCAENFLEEMLDNFKCLRYCVNSGGHSALFTAGYDLEFDAWALLKSRGFEYLVEEKKEMSHMEENEINKGKFNRALGKYFVPMDKCHVQRMIKKSLVRGDLKRDYRDQIRRIYEDIDSNPMTSLLLQFLQSDPHLEVVFDLVEKDIRCIVTSSERGCFGVTDFDLNRVYVSTAFGEHCDAVGNLAHELSHKVMFDLFKNDGLPYRKCDEESKKNADEERKKNDDEKSKNDYDDIVRKIMSKDRIDKCDVIIKRVKDYGEAYWPHELIVRVAEMVAKYNEKTDAPNGLERLESEANEAKDARNGLVRLEFEANELLEYYLKFVQPQIEKHIEENRKKHWMPTVDLLSFPEILSKQIKKHIDVECVHPPHSSRHNGIRFLRVSNLKLGLRHLEKVSENLVCMDWSVYTNAYKSFQYQLERGYIKNMAVVWDKHTGKKFCCGNGTCKRMCPARDCEPYEEFVTLIIPKDFNVHDDKVETNEYGWSHLSTDTKDWVLKKMVSFQGSEVLLPLRQLLEGVVGKGKAEGWMEGNVSAGYLSMLIDQADVIIGGDVVSALQKRRKELLREHPNSFIQRKTRVRPIQLSREMFERRTSDAFFIRCSRKSDLPQEWFEVVNEWNSDGIPDDSRCFLLDEDWNAQLEEEAFKGIFENLRRKSPTERKLLCLHFFTHEKENNKFSHFHSESVNGRRALILADAPGSGKSVYINAIARDEKNSSPCKWIQVVELTLREKELNECKDLDLTLKKNVEEMLFKLVIGRVKEGKTSEEMDLFEKKIFKLFCQSEEKVSLYVDGVDEVCPDYRDMTNSFLKGVLETTKVKLVVSCRIHECANLEENLKTISHHLDPYSEKELISFLDFEWNAKLNSLHGEGRQKTLSAILSNMKKENPSLIQNLESFMEKKVDRVNFTEVAKDLIEVGKSNRRPEDNIMAMPLIAWIASQVAFEENLNISSQLNLVNLYKKLIEMKIDLYVTEKARTAEFVVAEELREGFKSKIYDSLKKFAASFFLRENDSRVEQKYMKRLIRVGLVAERDGVNAFVHRTIGEYILSLVLLDGEVKGEKLTQVLLKEEFHQVRRFLDGQLPSFGEERSSYGEEGDEKQRSRLLNLPKIPSGVEDEIMSFKKCLYLSIAERNEGISRNLMESCGEYVERVVYEEAKIDVRELNLSVDDSLNTTEWNAFTLFGQFILGNVRIGNKRTTITSRIQCLGILLNFLKWIQRKDNLIGRFKGVLTDQNLVWMGFGAKSLWEEEEGKKQFELLLEILIGVKSVLGESVKKALMAKESESLFNYAAEHSIKSFLQLLDTYLKTSDFDDLLLPSSQNTSPIKCKNVVCAWTTVAKRSGVEGLQLFWDWLRSKMESPEMMKRFLRRKDVNERNALYASFCNEKYPNVSAHVWKLYGELFDGSELKDYLLNTFIGVELKSEEFNKFPFFEWIIGLLSSRLLNEDEVASLFVSKDKRGEYYLLNLFSRDIFPSPSRFSRVQRFFFERLRSKEEIVWNMEEHYVTMTHSCFTRASWIGVDVEFEREVESAFEAMRPSILSFPPFRDFRLDGEGNFVGVVDFYTAKRVNVIRFKAFGVLLRRQVEMEQGMLGREEAVKRLKGEWEWMFDSFPFLRIEGREGKNRRTSELSVRFTFAVLSVILTKEEIAEILLGRNYFNPLQGALFWPIDPMSFLALYDIGRWCVAEDALWRVHAVEWGEGETVLESLLEKQEEGHFDHIEDFLPHENVSPEGSTSN